MCADTSALLADLRRTDPTRLRFLLALSAPADASVGSVDLALIVDALHRRGQLAAMVTAWAATARPSTSAAEAAEAAELLAAAADIWRTVHQLDEMLGEVVGSPVTVDDVTRRLLDLAAADDVVVEWRALRPPARGYYSPGRVILCHDATARELAHELGHHFDPRPPKSIDLAERERFADALGALLVALDVIDPHDGHQLGAHLVAESCARHRHPTGRGTSRAGVAPVVIAALDDVDRVALHDWFASIAAGLDR